MWLRKPFFHPMLDLCCLACFLGFIAMAPLVAASTGPDAASGLEHLQSNSNQIPAG
jgi:hypothetical protein